VPTSGPTQPGELDNAPHPSRGKRLLVAMKPPMPPDDMTEEELDEWAGAIYDALSARVPRKGDEKAKSDEKPDASDSAAD